MDITGLIIAGGESSRFHEPKAFAKYKNKDFYLHSVEALNSVTDNIIIVTKEEYIERFDHQLTVIVDDDSFRGMGPLAGLYSGMKQVESEWYTVLPVDTPCMTGEILKKLLPSPDSGIQAYIPVVKDRKQPMIASYHNSVKQTIYDLLSKDKRSMHGFLEQIHAKYVPFGDHYVKCFSNINTKEEFSKINLE
ncbi:molybdopterin-guanine dinucleotide biosynthesis protein A [Gracilibacillus ureilyticus]|uniref:Probable molybdenum cofactor guanylyltransferase n=1 Tax=Gracilibacillus ureilyticus TaxID=531814 RepID=A0A1H9S2I3_9BACI|nr:molybdenum cofactor guanylyltransferase [Gracilibacillus ureilyticus]SER78349.1 molybdopterin-guanine dinucleotide biosynthesis protein A [Gracilibacillus ureilyticus]